MPQDDYDQFKTMSKSIEGGLRVRDALVARERLQEEGRLHLERLRSLHARLPNETAAAATRVASQVKAAFWRHRNSQGYGTKQRVEAALDAYKEYVEAEGMCAVTQADARRARLEVGGAALERALKKMPAAMWWSLAERGSKLEKFIESIPENQSRRWDVGVELHMHMRSLLGHRWSKGAEFEIDASRGMELSVIAREALSDEAGDALASDAIRRLESSALRCLAPDPGYLDGFLYGMSLRELLLRIQPFEFVEQAPAIHSRADAGKNTRVHRHAIDERLILLGTIAFAALRTEYGDLPELDLASGTDSSAAEPDITAPSPKRRPAKKKPGRPVKFPPEADERFLAEFEKSNLTAPKYEDLHDLVKGEVKRVKARTANRAMRRRN